MDTLFGILETADGIDRADPLKIKYLNFERKKEKIYTQIYRIIPYSPQLYLRAHI
jgi:hypothetical protein